LSREERDLYTSPAMQVAALQPFFSGDIGSGTCCVAETPAPAWRPAHGGPRLLDRVREALRVRHYSRRTERAYVQWIRRFILFYGKRHPAEMGAEEVTRFLSWLAVDRRVSASTQNQALSALLFLYAEVLDIHLPWLDQLVRASRPQRLPVVLSRAEGAGLRSSNAPAYA
jgi:hypothetical protein